MYIFGSAQPRCDQRLCTGPSSTTQVWTMYHPIDVIFVHALYGIEAGSHAVQR